MRFSDLDSASVGVWGVGREIRSFATQLERHLPSARIGVVALDTHPVGADAEGIADDAALVVGEGVVQALARCDVVVRSPGVSIHRPEVEALRDRGIPIVTATGLWLAERGGAGVVGITGTKGKSTTASFAYHLARAAGRDAELAGNIGLPALDLIDRDASGPVFLELSSYQIADLETGPEIAVITNLYREHLDWHGSELAYREEKLRLFDLPGVRMAVVNARAPELVRTASGVESRVAYGEAGGWDCDALGVYRDGDLVIGEEDLPLRGEHNALNLCAALASLEAAGVNLPRLPEALDGFGGLPHRLQVLGERDGLTWVDDSISTTPESTLAALASFADRDIVLLGGGQDRGQDYAELGRVLAARRTIVVGVPTTGNRLVQAAKDAGAPPGRAVGAPDLGAAVARARELAAPGSVILLSPAAPSYDRYRDFQERGERFRSLMPGGAG